ncbi:formate/nitrite transporter family protein [Verrucomicrobiota bacterium sgz303538]
MEESKQKQSKAEAEERSSPSTHVVYESIRSEGEEELKRASAALAWSGLAAGLSMGFSFISEGILKHHLPAAGWQPLVTKLGYSVGFLVVILGRQQLFTENTLTVILPLLLRKNLEVLLNVLRLWGVVLCANLLGGLMFAFVLGYTEVFDQEMRKVFGEIATESMSAGFGTTLIRGIFAGWLIALMVWLLPFAEAARIWIIIILTYLIGVAHFPHVIAGAVEVFYLGVSGARAWGEIVGGYLVPTLIGNIIGGVTLVAALAHVQVVSGNEALDA